MSRENPKDHQHPQRIFLGVLGLATLAILPACSAATQTEREELVIRPNTESQLSSLWVQSEEIPGTNEIRVIVEWEQGNRTQLYSLIRLPDAVSVITYAGGTPENPRVFSLQYNEKEELLLAVELLPNGDRRHVSIQ